VPVTAYEPFEKETLGGGESRAGESTVRVPLAAWKRRDHW